MLNAIKKSLLQLKEILQSDIKLRIAAVFSVLAVIALLLYAMVTQPMTAPPDSALGPETVAIESLEALDSASGLISSTPTFKVVVSEEAAVATIQNSIQAVPSVPLVVEAISATEFSVRPKAALPKGALLSLAYQSSSGMTSKAFQVAGSLRLTSVYPADGATEVPENTGIELVFSEAVDQGIIDHISLSPEIPYTVDIQDNLVRITAKSRFEKDTLYTLDVDSGYKSALGASLNASRKLQFFTGPRKTYDQRTVLSTHLFQNNEPLQLSLNYNLVANSFAVKIFAVDDAVALSQQYYQLEALSASFVKPEQQLESNQGAPVFEGSLPANTLGDASPTRYLQLPDLSPGAYRIECESDLGNQVAFVQISPLALYFEFDDIKNHGLLWALEAKTAEAAKVTVAPLEAKDRLLATSDVDGIAQFDLEDGFVDLIVATPNQQVWIPDNAFGISDAPYFSYNSSPEAQKAAAEAAALKVPLPKEQAFNVLEETPVPMTFLYTDRTFYTPGESIYFFGIVRFADKRPLDTVYIRPYEDETATPIAVPVDANGTFHIEIPQAFIQFARDYNILEVGSPYGYIGSHSFGLGVYEKPEVLVSAKVEKPILGPDDPLMINGAVTHVDGSAMTGYKLNFVADGLRFDSAKAAAETDIYGQYALNLPIQKDTENVNTPFNYYYIEVQSAETENVEAAASQEIVYFPSNTILDVDALLSEQNAEGRDGLSDGRGEFSITANTLKLPKSWSELYDDANIKGAPLSLPVTYTLEDAYFEKIPESETYDPILKEKVVKYRYEYKQSIVDTGSMDIVEGKATYRFEMIPEHSYTLRIQGKDATGLTLESQATFNAPYTYDSHYSNLAPDTPMAIRHMLIPNDQMPSLPMEVKLAPGEAFKVPLTVPEGLKKITDPKLAKTLFLQYDQHYKQHAVQGGLEPVYTNRFTEESLPSGMVKAVFYDGYRFQNSGEPPVTTLILHPDAYALDLEITTDKARYGPGETLKGTITLKAKGRPVSGSVWISAVDMAFLAIYPETQDARTEFYKPHYRTGVSLSYHTAMNVNGAMAEMGEGDAEGGYIREDFKSTAYARLIAVDNSGRASFSFELPDNITTWRIAAHGIDQEGNIATRYHEAVCSKPFYLRYLLAPTITRFDTPILLLSSRILTQVESLMVNYTWQLDQAGTITGEGASDAAVSQALPVDLGSLKTGAYTLLLSGSAKESPDFKDRVKLQLSVVDSLVHFPATQEVSLKNGETWESPATDVSARVTLWHQQAQTWRNALVTLTAGDTKRLEYYLSSFIAQRLLLGEDNPFAVPKDLLDGFIAADPSAERPLGYKPLVSAEQSLQLTADVISLLPELHRDSQAWQEIYQNAPIPSDNTDAQIDLLRIRSVLKQPVLYDLHQVAKQSLTASQRLSLAWAFLEIGDAEMARAQYADHKNALGMSATDPVRLKYLSAVVAAMLSRTDAATLYQQAEDATPKQHTYQLLQLAYLTRISMPLEPVRLTASYMAKDGQLSTTTIDIKDHQPVTIDLIAGKTLSVQDVSGPVDIRMDYEGRLNNVSFNLTDYTLQRSFSNTDIRLGESIAVKVTVKGPKDRYYRLTETIPAGFNAITKGGLVKGDQLLFYPSGTGSEQTFEYTLKPAMAGRFLCEPSVLTGYNPEVTSPSYLKGDEVYLNVAP